MKKLLAIVVFGLLWCNVGFAETAKEQASRLLLNKFKFAIEGVLFGLLFSGIAFVLAKIIKILFKKDITYSNFYIHAFWTGFILRIVILVLIK